MMELYWIAFSDRGEDLAARLAHIHGGSFTRAGKQASVKEWTKEHFVRGCALIFVGACGIAVRSVAPFVRGKTVDPAVIVIDDTGRFVIPILSGHLGGANDLAREIAQSLGAEAVITTATDRNGIFAVDEWARHQGCVIANPEQIRVVSSRLLSGGTVRIGSDWAIAGKAPDGVVPGAEPDCDIHLTLRGGAASQKRRQHALLVIPRILVLGIGCRRGTAVDILQERIHHFLEEAGYAPDGVFRVCSIDRKADEPGLLELCQMRGWEFVTYSAEELARLAGTFQASAFTLKQVGVDNVCERAAVLGSGGRLLVGKDASDGVTLALAAAPFSPDWGQGSEQMQV